MRRFLLVSALVCALVAPAIARAQGLKVSGPFWSPLGLLELKQTGAKVVGKVSARCAVCPFKKGDEVFSGVLLEDSLAGKMRYCLKGKGCQGDGWAPMVMLVAREGRVLSGAAHFKAGEGCQVGGKGNKDGVVLRKVRPQPRKPPVPVKPPAPDAGVAEPAPDAGTAVAEPAPDAGTAVAEPAPDAGTAEGGPVEPPPGDPAGEEPKDESGQALVAEVEKPDPAKYAQNEGTWRSAMESGAGFLQTGQFERARKSFLAASELDPTRPEALNGVGVTYYARHDYEAALEWYKKALEVDANFSDAYYNMACIYALQRKANMAFRYLHIAALNGFVQPDVLEADEDLGALRSDPRYKDILAQMRKTAR